MAFSLVVVVYAACIAVGLLCRLVRCLSGDSIMTEEYAKRLTEAGDAIEEYMRRLGFDRVIVIAARDVEDTHVYTTAMRRNCDSSECDEMMCEAIAIMKMQEMQEDQST